MAQIGVIQQRHMRTSILWRSHLYSGHDYCTIQNVRDGWELSGTALLIIDNLPGRLDYVVHCDRGWKTSSASIEGYVRNKTIGIQVEVNDSRDWIINGRVQSDLRGCLDIDLAFTPATNTLPIRRLRLGAGDSMTTRAAWLKVPEFRFSALDQQYSQTSESEYLYQSPNNSYSALLSVNSAGFATSCPEMWDQEGATQQAAAVGAIYDRPGCKT